MYSKLQLEIIVLAGLITSIVSFPDKSFFGPEFGVVQKVYEDCQNKNDFTGCLKGKALTALSKAVEQDTVKIIDGITLEKQNVTDKETIVGITDARTLSTMSPMDRSLIEKLDMFLRSHILKIEMNQGRKGDEGGYGGGGGDKKGKKDDKGIIKYVVAALLTAIGIASPVGLKMLAAIAVKALVISKVALTIASIIALKKLLSHDHHEETSFQVHAGEHNRRNTYVVRPVRPSPNTMEPYRYYYEYPTH